MKKVTLGSIILVVLAVGPAWAGSATVEKGHRFFNDPGLGGSGNELSCNSCHPDGKGLEEAGDSPKLARIINRCLNGPLMGRKIDDSSLEMRSLKMYILSL